jgi:hypothetical protein
MISYKRAFIKLHYSTGYIIVIETIIFPWIFILKIFLNSLAKMKKINIKYKHAL